MNARRGLDLLIMDGDGLAQKDSRTRRSPRHPVRAPTRKEHIKRSANNARPAVNSSDANGQREGRDLPFTTLRARPPSIFFATDRLQMYEADCSCRSLVVMSPYAAAPGPARRLATCQWRWHETPRGQSRAHRSLARASCCPPPLPIWLARFVTVSVTACRSSSISPPSSLDASWPAFAVAGGPGRGLPHSLDRRVNLAMEPPGHQSRGTARCAHTRLLRAARGPSKRFRPRPPLFRACRWRTNGGDSW